MRTSTRSCSGSAIRRSSIGLAQIAWDGSQKLRFRILGTVRDALAAGRSVDQLCVPLAAWGWFARWKSEQRSVIVDPLAARLAQLGRDWGFDAQADVERLLQLRDTFGDDLRADPRFRAALERAYRRVADFPGATAQCLSACGSQSESCGNSTTSSRTASEAI